MQQLVEMLGCPCPFALGSAAVGLVVARTAVDDPAALALLALPTILIVAAYRAYTGAREQQDNLRLLHEVTSLLHAGDSQEALGDFLDSVRSAFRAEMAELVLLGPAGREGATVSRSREGDEAVVMAPLDDPEDHHRLLRLATRVRRPHHPHRYRPRHAARQLRHRPRAQGRHGRRPAHRRPRARPAARRRPPR